MWFITCFQPCHSIMLKKQLKPSKKCWENITFAMTLFPFSQSTEIIAHANLSTQMKTSCFTSINYYSVISLSVSKETFIILLLDLSLDKVSYVTKSFLTQLDSFDYFRIRLEQQIQTRFSRTCSASSNFGDGYF